MMALSPLMAWAQNAAITVNRSEMIRILGDLPSAMPIRQDLQSLGFEGANLELAVAQAGSFYKDPVIAGYIADRVIAAYTDPSAVVEAQGLIWPMISRGMGHVSLSELRYYYSVEQAMINAMSIRDCGQAMRGEFSDKQFSDALSRMAARLDTDALKEFYRIEFKAAQLGAKRGAARLTEAQKRAAGAAIDVRLEALLQSEPDAERLRGVMLNLDRARNKDACRIGRLFYTAVLTLPQGDQRNGLLLLGQP
ncbi:MAG: hypothetical protein AAF641_04400 [Pseudomonadota bacterium]